MSSDLCYTTMPFEMKVGQRLIAVPQLDIAPGQVVGIAGKNGAGKTVLMRHWMGWVDDSQMVKRGKWVQEKLSVGWLNTRREPYADLWVEDVVALGIKGDFDPVQFENVLAEMELMTIRHQSMNTISDGEWMRMMMARVMLQQPNMILMDEPTAHLDFYYKSYWMSWVRKLAENGVTVICASHDEAWLKTTDLILGVNEKDIQMYNPIDFTFESLKNVHIPIK
jgi:iron complex transport system ATP-binding protein